MSDVFDPNDFDAPRRDLSAFFSGLSKAIRDNERGYQAGLRGTAAAFVAIYNVVAEDFSAFSEMIEHECFADDKKIHSLTKNDYRKYVAECVVKRGFAGSGAFSSTVSKFTTTLKYLVSLEVEPGDCAKTIKDAGGFTDFYELAVAAKRLGNVASGSDEKGAPSKEGGRSKNKSTSKGRSSKSSLSDNMDDEQDDDDQYEQEDDGEDEAVSPRGTRPKAFPKTFTVEEIFDNYLLVRMPTKKLDRYRKGPFSDDERRGMEIAYQGKGPKGLHEWAFVSKLVVEASNAPEEDNDNDTDDEEEEDAA